MLPAPFFTLGRELNQAENRLRKLFGPEFGLENFPMTEPVGWVPTVEVVETDAELVLTAELPGLEKENVEITFENEMLTIRGEKKEEKKEEKNGGKYLMWERTYGEFVRTFTLPKTIEAAKIAAEMKNGVLTIHLPKTATPKVKGQKIEIAAK
jgi:HSP20 family protein